MSLLLVVGTGGTTTTLTASKGTLTLTGKAAAFIDRLNAAKGALSLTGSAATTVQRLLAAKGALTLTGKDATFTIATVLTAAKGALTLTGADANLLEIAGEEPDTHDGVGRGGAGIIYKRPHKKLHDEIEEYFALLGETATEEEIAEVAEAVADRVPDLQARSAVAEAIQAQVNAALEARRQTEELMELLARAQDEDDAEAVLVMLEMC